MARVKNSIWCVGESGSRGNAEIENSLASSSKCMSAARTLADNNAYISRLYSAGLYLLRTLYAVIVVQWCSMVKNDVIYKKFYNDYTSHIL